jgi:RHS repeat-associated protein
VAAGGTTTSFGYDAFGRRTTKTVTPPSPGTPTTTTYLHDGLNPLQERVGTAVTNLLTGVGLDELLTRTDNSGTRTLLGDILGSAVALVGASGVESEYTYEPFGRLTSTPTTNTYQYTGRENDGTGPYYYRARYYHPTLGRFVSEDPLEFGGGDLNLYGYVGNSPTSFRDPLGECTAGAVAAGTRPGQMPGCGGGGFGPGLGGAGASASVARPAAGAGSLPGGMRGMLRLCRLFGHCGAGEATTPPPPATSTPKPCAGGSGDEGPFIYRRGGKNPGNYKPDPVDGGIPFNLDPNNLLPGEYQVFDPSKLPPGSWTPDEGQPVPGKPGQVYPAGHVSVRDCSHG